MSNISVQNVDQGQVEFKDGIFHDDLLTFGGAGTVAKGTILARSVASGKYIPYVKGGSTDGNGVPKAVITYDVTAEGAGDVAVRALTSGIVYFSKLVIAADGDNSNVDKAVLDLLRDQKIDAVDSTQLNILDNQ